MTNTMTDPRFALARKKFTAACRASRAHSEKAAAALASFGSHGPDVSGCVRAHFPDSVKNELRFWAREVTRHSNAGYAARPKRVHFATMRKLAAEIATRDGSGFYGPQPNQKESKR